MKRKQIKKTNEPEKSLISILKKHSGRDSSGRISVRHKGGRQKRYYRYIDFKRDKRGVSGIVEKFEYDPNRSSDIALIKYDNGEKRYILAAAGLKIGDKVIAADAAEVKVGNALKIRNVPLGTQIHNIELYPGQGGQIVKSAGSFATVLAKDEKYADIKLPSKEVRKVLLDCYASIGQLSNISHKLEKIGKAGRSRHMGIRPTVRGVAQHPASHPHGGGEGKSGTGMHPKTPWGKTALGKKTRKKTKWSNKLIVKRRS